MRQDIAFFDKNSPVELNSILSGNMETYNIAIGYKLIDFLMLMGRGVACLLFAMIRSWKFSIIFLPFVPLIIICTNLMIRVLKKFSIREFVSYGKAGKVAQEVLSSLKTVIAFGLQQKFIRIYEENLQDAESNGIQKGKLMGFFEGLASLFSNLCFGICFVYAIHLTSYECKNYDTGIIISSIFCIVNATFAIGQALPFLSDLGQAKSAAKKVFDIIETESKIDIFTTNTKRFDNLKGHISFENVFFNYPSRPDFNVLQCLTLNISAGKTVAICGARLIKI